MSNKNENKRQSKRDKLSQNAQSSETTTPVNLKSGDKLRENPSNDEETISQGSRKWSDERTEQSPISRQHDGGRNQVTNEDDQQEIVNPTGEDWDEPEKDPKPTKNPYEEIGDDPDGTQRKIPKM